MSDAGDEQTRTEEPSAAEEPLSTDVPGLKPEGSPTASDRRASSGEARAASSPRTRSKARRRGAATPMMTQYLRLKEEVGDAILFFRMGDFYEMFFEDAVDAAELLDLTLTSRNKSDPEPIPMAGVPWHSAEPYIARLLKRGRRVAICEQVEVPGNRMMDRRIVEILTPGTALAEGLLEDARNNYLAALAPMGARWGLAVADVSTGEFALGDLSAEAALAEVERLAPQELILPPGAERQVELAGLLSRQSQIFLAERDEWHFSSRRGEELLEEQFGVATLEPFGVADLQSGLAAAGALLEYAREQKRSPLAHLRPPRALREGEGVLLDEATLRNLEVLAPLLGRGRHCLLGVLDETRTAMGSRALRRVLSRPLTDLAAIRARHAAVGALLGDPASLEAMRSQLRRVADLERLIGRLHCGRGSTRDLARGRDSLEALPELLRLAKTLNRGGDFPIGSAIDPLPDLREELTLSLMDNPALGPDGDVIREGYDSELDELRSLAHEGRDWIARLQAQEREATGIPTLKVGYNKVFGYYLEVTRTHLERVPERYQRKQTLVGAERYVTPELKEWEERIVEAQGRARARQEELIARLQELVRAQTGPLQGIADAVAEWDLAASFATVARRGGYVRPEMNDGDRIHIAEGRHPVVERFLDGESFVPNDITVDTRDHQILIITGPNMAGKSTYLRQVGLLVLMAQAGCFVPAREARIGVADRIFTRVGASDNIARGQSTFLVEMVETSHILHEATSRSLVLLDEIGRGTSTYDGLAIAWAVAERLRENALRRPRTLFATHFHELTALARRRDGYCNLNVLVKEWKDRVIFVRRVVEGSADRSYGIQVARLAGLPESVLARAREILTDLEQHGPLRIQPIPPGGEGAPQISLFVEGKGALDDSDSEDGGRASGEDGPSPASAELAELRAELATIDPDQLSPREALAWIYRLRELLHATPPEEGAR